MIFFEQYAVIYRGRCVALVGHPGTAERIAVSVGGVVRDGKRKGRWDMPRIELTSYDTDLDENGYAAWCEYVCERLRTRTGFRVEIVVDEYGTTGSDRIVGSGEERETISEAVAHLWEEWCADYPGVENPKGCDPR